MSEEPKVVYVERKSNNLIGCLVFIVLAVLALTYCSPPDPLDETTSFDETLGLSDPAIPLDIPDTISNEVRRVSIDELVAAYDRNEAAAQSDYGGQLLYVEGVISSVTLDFEDLPKAAFVADIIPEPSARFSEGFEFEAETLVKGERTAVVCAELSEFLGAPQLKDCRLASSLNFVGS